MTENDVRRLLADHLTPAAVDDVLHRPQAVLDGATLAEFARRHDDDEVRHAVAGMFRFDRANG